MGNFHIDIEIANKNVQDILDISVSVIQGKGERNINTNNVPRKENFPVSIGKEVMVKVVYAVRRITAIRFSGFGHCPNFGGRIGIKRRCIKRGKRSYTNDKMIKIVIMDIESK